MSTVQTRDLSVTSENNKQTVNKEEKIAQELRLCQQAGGDLELIRKEGLNLNQLIEVRQGLQKKVDVSLYCKKEYASAQMREIRLGLESDIPVIFYLNVAFDWTQMREIRLGLSENLDISSYAYPNITHLKMHVIRESLKDSCVFTKEQIKKFSASVLDQIHQAYLSKIDLSQYLALDYDEEQLEQIRLALEQKLPMEPYFDPIIRGESLKEIRLGLSENLDVSIYANTEFTWQQMHQIRIGLERKVDVSVYAKPLYLPTQMREIRKGLEKNVDVSQYSSMMYTAKEMRQIRHRLENGEDIVKGQQAVDPLVPGGAPAIKTQTLTEERMRTGETKDILSSKNGYSEVVDQEHFVKITPDNMKVFLKLPRLLNGKNYTTKFIVNLLNKMQIVRGVKKDVIEDMLTKQMFDEDVLVAEGQGPKFGKDGYYEYFFDRMIPSQPEFNKDGTMNLYRVKYFITVKAGAKLAEYHQAIPGRDGFTVKGVTLPGKNGRELDNLKGYGFMEMKDRVYCSAVSGTVRIEPGFMYVDPLMTIENTENTPLNIDHAGSVWVKADVPPRSVIKARGDVIIDGLAENAVIESGGNVVFRVGANGLERRGSIKAAGCVYAGYLLQMDIIAEKSIYTNECINCKVHTKGEIIAYGDSGRIFGCEIISQMGVNTAYLGNDVNSKTVVSIGATPEVEASYNECKEKLEKLKEELKTLSKEQKKAAGLDTKIAKNLQWKTKITIAVSMKEKELEACKQKKHELEELISRINNAVVEVRRTVYEGCLLIIAGTKIPVKKTRSEKGGIIFTKE